VGIELILDKLYILYKLHILRASSPPVYSSSR